MRQDQEAEAVLYSVVIPTYRGGPCLGELVRRLIAVMGSLGGSYEILFVDDASPDGSWEVLCSLKSLHGAQARIRAFRLIHNVGQFRALMCGLEHSRGEFVVTMDDDLQNPPEEIPRLVSAMRAHPEMDAVIGAFARKEHHLFRNLGSRLIDAVNCVVSNKPRSLKTTSFRLLRRCLVDAIVAHRTINPVMGPLVVRSSNRIMNVPVQHHPRREGESNYGVCDLFRMALDHVLNFSTIPLKAISVLGIASSALSAALGAFFFWQFWTGNVGVEVRGWTTLVLLLLFYCGLVLFSLGLIGEYLIRIINEVSRSPRYVVRDRL
jgi:glycosyltransferase involved in cell wall biosynthesis